jgi:hypothetical protein
METASILDRSSRQVSKCKMDAELSLPLQITNLYFWVPILRYTRQCSIILQPNSFCWLAMATYAYNKSPRPDIPRPARTLEVVTVRQVSDRLSQICCPWVHRCYVALINIHYPAQQRNSIYVCIYRLKSWNRTVSRLCNLANCRDTAVSRCLGFGTVVWRFHAA